MKVRVERIRRGRRTREVEYVEAREPRRRPPEPAASALEQWESELSAPSTLRLPWRINSTRK